MKKIVAFITITMLSMLCHASWGPFDFQISKNSGDDSPMIVSPWGSWIGSLEHAHPMDYQKTHELIFEFETPDYFETNNIGHFAIAARAGTSNGLQGRGIILGNVTLYNPTNAPCTPTSLTNTIAIEHFIGTEGNCVYGNYSQGVSLQNNLRYRVQLTSSYVKIPWSEDITITRYTLWERKDARWKFRASSAITELLSGPTFRSPEHSVTPLIPALDSMGFFVLEVFSSHTWSFNIYNMTSKSCSTPLCTLLY